MNIEHNIVRQSQSGIMGLATLILMAIAAVSAVMVVPAFADEFNQNVQPAVVAEASDDRDGDYFDSEDEDRSDSSTVEKTSNTSRIDIAAFNEHNIQLYSGTDEGYVLTGSNY